jgi:Spy/CpxP family protein refolding chaperone
MRSVAKARLRPGRALLLLLAAVPMGFLGVPAAPAEGQSPQSAAPERATPPPDKKPGLDHRAERLAKLLDLTEAQQFQLAKVLASRHERIRKLWRDQAVPPEYRVSQMRAINDETERQIRALLTEEQKKKYFLPRQASGTADQSNLEYWLNATKPK